MIHLSNDPLSDGASVFVIVIFHRTCLLQASSPLRRWGVGGMRHVDTLSHRGPDHREEGTGDNHEIRKWKRDERMKGGIPCVTGWIAHQIRRRFQKTPSGRTNARAFVRLIPFGPSHFTATIALFSRASHRPQSRSTSATLIVWSRHLWSQSWNLNFQSDKVAR